MSQRSRMKALQSGRNSNDEMRPAAAKSMKVRSQTTHCRRNGAMSTLHRYFTCDNVTHLLLSYLSFADVDRRPPAMACVRWKSHLVGLLEYFLHRANT